MPQIGVEAFAVLLILLPGFLCARIVQSLCVRPKQTELDKVIEALLYTLLVYALFVILTGNQIPVSLTVETLNGRQRYALQTEPKKLVLLIVIPLGLALLIGWDSTNDLSGRVFRKLRLTQRTTRSSVWSDVFHEVSGIAQIELEDGRSLMGWISYYSDEPEDASVFLEKAAWITADHQLVPINGPGILITRNVGIKHIMFLDEGKESE
jgi:hypothetical protein